MVRQWQELLHEKNYSESYSEALPDFVKLAEAYGCKGIKAENPEELDVKIKEPEEVLWVKCKSCSQMIFNKEFRENINVCKACGFHDHLSAQERINFLLDKDTIENITLPKLKVDPLNFKDKKRYLDRLKEAQTNTKLEDALLVSFGLLNGIPLIVACFDFSFPAVLDEIATFERITHVYVVK